MEARIQVAYHFKIDPATLTPGAIRLPEQITRTISVGAEFTTAKVGIDCIPADDRAALLIEIEKQAREATRTARPVTGAGSAPASEPQADEEEMSAF